VDERTGRGKIVTKRQAKKLKRLIRLHELCAVEHSWRGRCDADELADIEQEMDEATKVLHAFIESLIVTEPVQS
jgi:acetylglutamate synthase